MLSPFPVMRTTKAVAVVLTLLSYGLFLEVGSNLFDGVFKALTVVFFWLTVVETLTYRVLGFKDSSYLDAKTIKKAEKVTLKELDAFVKSALNIKPISLAIGLVAGFVFGAPIGFFLVPCAHVFIAGYAFSKTKAPLSVKMLPNTDSSPGAGISSGPTSKHTVYISNKGTGKGGFWY